MVSPKLQLLSELQLPPQWGWQQRQGQAGAGGGNPALHHKEAWGWGTNSVAGVPILDVALGAAVLILESCHCALRTLGTGNTGQQEHGEPEAPGTGRTGSQWTLGTLGPGTVGALGALGVWRVGALGSLVV